MSLLTGKISSPFTMYRYILQYLSFVISTFIWISYHWSNCLRSSCQLLAFVMLYLQVRTWLGFYTSAIFHYHAILNHNNWMHIQVYTACQITRYKRYELSSFMHYKVYTIQHSIHATKHLFCSLFLKQNNYSLFLQQHSSAEGIQ